MFIKGIAIFLSSCRNVGAELIISKRATQSYFWVTLLIIEVSNDSYLTSTFAERMTLPFCILTM